ncbi:hypothetical protein OEZ84_28240, partial [Leclercia adecarboxylata]|uniref:hypothetical protein n=1 Tax=Leclercia adecarboxylata TaxID=83655 RepID=UPI00234D8E30
AFAAVKRIKVAAGWTVVESDNFNRADVSPMDNGWVSPFSSGDLAFDLASNGAVAPGGFASMRRPVSRAANQRHTIELTASTTTRIFARIGSTHYKLEMDFSYTPDRLIISYWDGSSYTELGFYSGDLTIDEI